MLQSFLFKMTNTYIEKKKINSLFETEELPDKKKNLYN